MVLMLLLGDTAGSAQTPVPPATRPSGQGTESESGSPAFIEFSQLKVRHRPPAPSYPPLARVAGIQGTMVVRITVGANGFVETAEALEGPAMLRPAAVAICRAWRFDPVEVGGKPSRVQSELRMPFKLKDVPDSGREAQISQAVIDLEMTHSPLAAPIDPGAIQKEIDAWLAQVGLIQTSQTGADPAKTIHLSLKIQAVRTPDGLYIHDVMERASLLSDRGLKENKAGAPQRICFFDHAHGRKGESGFADSLLNTVRRSLTELIVPQVMGPPSKVAPGGGTLPADRSEPGRPLVVDFDFSQIKVKTQPAAPPYPALAKLAGIQGTVVLELTIDPAGATVDAEAVSGPTVLLVHAIRFALQWEFEPARLNGVPQFGRFKLTMPFRLAQRPPEPIFVNRR